MKLLFSYILLLSHSVTTLASDIPICPEFKKIDRPNPSLNAHGIYTTSRDTTSGDMCITIPVDSVLQGVECKVSYRLTKWEGYLCKVNGRCGLDSSFRNYRDNIVNDERVICVYFDHTKPYAVNANLNVRSYRP